MNAVARVVKFEELATQSPRAEVMSEQFFKFTVSVIADGVWADLSPSAKAIYPVICSKVAGKQFDRISRTQLMKLGGVKCPHAIAKAISELTEKGLISVEKSNGKLSQYSLTSVVKPMRLNNTGTVKPMRLSHTALDKTSVVEQHTTLDIYQSINLSEAAAENLLEPTPPVADQKFTMHINWQPDHAGQELLKLSRVDLSTPENQTDFAEFLAYWIAQGTERTQAEWNKTLLRNFSSAAKAKRAAFAADATKPKATAKPLPAGMGGTKHHSYTVLTQADVTAEYLEHMAQSSDGVDLENIDF